MASVLSPSTEAGVPTPFDETNKDMTDVAPPEVYDNKENGIDENTLTVDTKEMEMMDKDDGITPKRAVDDEASQNSLHSPSKKSRTNDAPLEESTVLNQSNVPVDIDSLMKSINSTKAGLEDAKTKMLALRDSHKSLSERGSQMTDKIGKFEQQLAKVKQCQDAQSEELSKLLKRRENSNELFQKAEETLREIKEKIEARKVEAEKLLSRVNLPKNETDSAAAETVEEVDPKPVDDASKEDLDEIKNEEEEEEEEEEEVPTEDDEASEPEPVVTEETTEEPAEEAAETAVEEIEETEEIAAKSEDKEENNAGDDAEEETPDETEEPEKTEAQMEEAVKQVAEEIDATLSMELEGQGGVDESMLDTGDEIEVELANKDAPASIDNTLTEELGNTSDNDDGLLSD